MKKDLTFFEGKIIAHRGYHGEKYGIPENSMLSFRKAIEKGYAIEIDLHLLKDGNIVVMHDDTTTRMTGVDKILKNCTYNDLKDLRLNNTNEHIPLLQEVLELVDGKVPLLIEYKYDLKAGILEEKSMEILKQYKGKFAIQSFSPFSVKWFKDNYKEIPRGQLSYDYKDENIGFFKKIIMKNLFTNIINKPDFISYSIKSMPRKRITKLREKGLIIAGWTIKNKKDYDFAKKYCDLFISEYMDEYAE